MDRKSAIVLALSFLVLLLWVPLVNKIFPPIPAPQRTNTVAGVTNTMPASNAPPANLEAARPATNAPAVPLVKPGAPEELLVVESADARYTFTSHGGGLKQIEMKHYPETVECGAGKKNSTNRLVTLNAGAGVPVLALLGGESLQGDGLYALTRTATGVRAEKLLTNGLQVVKEFELGSNYLVRARVTFSNTRPEPLALPLVEWAAGTAVPVGLVDEAINDGVFWSHGGSVEHVDAGWFANRFLGCFPGTPRTVFAGGTSNVLWAAGHNQFFALAVVPSEPATQVVIVETNLPPPTREQLAQQPKATLRPVGFQTTLQFAPLTLAPTQSVERIFHVYAGPKEYNTLARIASQLKNNLDLVMGFDTGFGGTIFGFFAKILLLSMNGLHSFGLSYGLTIIVITVIIKLLFWPLTNASTKSMKRMAALQPQMKSLQEKYKDDPAKMNRKLMEFMKEHKVNPMSGCLPMLLQIPVFFGFFTMMRTAIELRGAQFLWACDLSKSDTIFVIPGLGIPFNPMPLLMGATMLWQARLTPPSPGMDPMQQKIMKYFPLIFLVILYNYSAGLTLYWTVQNLLTIAQMKITKTKVDPVPAAKAPTITLPRKKK